LERKVEPISNSKGSQGKIMKNKSELYASVPEIRQQVFEQWYDEWETPEEASHIESHTQPLQPFTHLRSAISRLLHQQPTTSAYADEQGANRASANIS
jgi:hypothetical protein